MGYFIVAALLFAHRQYFILHTFLYGVPRIGGVFPVCALGGGAAGVGQSPSRLGVSHSLVPIRLVRQEGAVLVLIGPSPSTRRLSSA